MVTLYVEETKLTCAVDPLLAVHDHAEEPLEPVLRVGVAGKVSERSRLAGALWRLGQVRQRGQPLDPARPQHQAGLVVRAVGAGVGLEAVRGAEVLTLDALLVKVELVAVGAESDKGACYCKISCISGVKLWSVE